MMALIGFALLFTAGVAGVVVGAALARYCLYFGNFYSAVPALILTCISAYAICFAIKYAPFTIQFGATA